MKFTKIHALAFICGFISLCIEMFWVRYLGFAWQGAPLAFGYVLSAFLLGIAFGAWYGKKLCVRYDEAKPLLRQSAWWILAAAGCCLLTPMAYAKLYFHPLELPALFALIAANSFSLSVMFPIVHHLGVKQEDQLGQISSRALMGKHFSGIYCANVAGAALGPLIFGYVFIAFLGTQNALFALCVLCLAAALAYFYFSNLAGRWLTGLAAAGTAMLVGLFWMAPTDWLIHAVNSKPSERISNIYETRQGIVTIYEQPKGDDVVMGGNIYDGTTNVDLERNSNGLNRPLLMAALHAKPRRVLMVGLSVGSWLALVKEFPGVEHIDVVEINPGYLEAAKAYPAQLGALQDPRVKVHIQDARRWLKLNPASQYDVIFMNTTFHWRSNITLLLSKEYMQLLRSRMLPGAVLAFNATGSMDALGTAAHVFKHARRYANFVFAADWDFTSLPGQPASIDKYRGLIISGKPAFAPDSKQPETFLTIPLIELSKDESIANRKAEIITDYNMITEYKYGRP